MVPPPPTSTLFPYTTLFRSKNCSVDRGEAPKHVLDPVLRKESGFVLVRSEEHTSELQSLTKLVCRLLLEKKHQRTMLRSELRVLLSTLHLIAELLVSSSAHV